MLFPLHFCCLGLLGCWKRDICINQDETNTLSAGDSNNKEWVGGRYLDVQGKEGGREGERSGERERESKKSGGEALQEEDSMSPEEGEWR